ncbi:MAG: hemerythrin [Melioribacteraceae bacterium]|nr:MAG: hemerythrin [Melioribacteraceae bacterium]
MALFKWDSTLSVKVKDFDTEHQKLVELVNRLHDDMKLGKAKESIAGVLDELISYTQTHFRHEEKVMQANSYPGLLQHKAEHENLICQVAEFKQKFDTGSLTLSISIINFLSDWVKNHIMAVDKQYSDFLNSKGVK